MKLVNIYNNFREITLFCRNDNSELEIKTVKDFFPYFYVQDPEGNYKSYKGESLRKILVSNPADVRRNRNIDSYEADIIFTRRYMIDKVKELKPDILGLSALMTTTMIKQKEIIENLRKADLRKNVKIIVGGAPVTVDWVREIGADACSLDAGTAVNIVLDLMDGK